MADADQLAGVLDVGRDVVQEQRRRDLRPLQRAPRHLVGLLEGRLHGRRRADGGHAVARRRRAPDGRHDAADHARRPGLVERPLSVAAVRADRPVEPLVASFHLYNFSGCSTQSCWDSTVAPVATQVPVVTGEMGENDCAHGFVDGYMSWADAHHVSYLGWTCGHVGLNGIALIDDYQGTPTPYGAAFEAHLAALAGS